jgi:hypothetical protein
VWGRAPWGTPAAAAAMPQPHASMAQPHAAMAERAARADQDKAGEGTTGPDAGLPADGSQPLPGAMVTPPGSGSYDRPKPAKAVTPIGSLTQPGRAIVAGRVHTVEIRPVEHNTVLACDVEDSTGQLTALFYGRSNIPGLRPGSKVRLRGQVGRREGRPVMINPAYELLVRGEEGTPDDDPGDEPRRGRGRGRRDDRGT